MRKVTVLRMRERYAQTVLTFRITYVYMTMFKIILKICIYTTGCTRVSVNKIFTVDFGKAYCESSVDMRYAVVYTI